MKMIKNTQIADFMGVTASSVSHWFRGDNFLDIENLYKLCQFLDVTLDQVFGLEPIVFGVLDPDESSLLSAYRAADDRAREDALKTLLDHPRKKDEQSAI